MLLAVVGFVIGMGILIKGADWLISGSARGAKALRISPIVIGSSVVAFGTSAPEMVVSLVAAFSGSGDISVGNVIGSNICNIALVLGVAALISPLKIQPGVLRMDLPITVVASLVLFLLGRNYLLGRLEGSILIVLFVVYIVFLASRKRPPEVLEEEEGKTPSWVKSHFWLAIILGLLGITAGAKLMVDQGIKIAMILGVSQAVIGITLVALGTSLPELVTSAVASWRKEYDIGIGNVLGSNVFNILLVLGVVSAARPIRVDHRLFQVDIWIMLAYILALFPLFFTGFKLTRKEGILLLAGYILYLAYLYHPAAGR
ncbi:MAG TPA: calcium/sodium antiporter [Candidatus Latescibacteria bacterium]|nr:calcium/sodium antiporter [Candidatus Latescibacterota bacterium]